MKTPTALLAFFVFLPVFAAEPAPLIVNGPNEAGKSTLPVLPGVQTTCVLRASREHPETAEGLGYTYNHHCDMAVWKGRYYVAWNSCQTDQGAWPSRELYSTSPDGKTWSKPAELFPQGASTALRMYFFHAPNGTMLAIAGLMIKPDKTNELIKGPLVVRQINADHTLGTVYVLRAPAGDSKANKAALSKIKLPPRPPLYATSPDKTFVEACRQLLANHPFLEQQDYGFLLDAPARMPWQRAGLAAKKSDADKPKTAEGDDIGDTSEDPAEIGKAFSFFHRADGALVGIAKQRWVTVSRDKGKTWSEPVRPPTLISGDAKVWGQRTPDGRYALVYNPHPTKRLPLVVVTGGDGINFGGMAIVNEGTEKRRYEGRGKAGGAQYVRGVSEWSTDGSIVDKTGFWIVYSMNKEDICVSRIPLK